MKDKTRKTWETALEQFLKPWRKNKSVIGILVCGSYITGNPSKHSDIDVHIILSNKEQWRERGNKIIDGYLIEYFINPEKNISTYFEDDYSKNSRCSPVQFITGKILYDRKEEMTNLKKKANLWFKKKFKKPDRSRNEISKYGLWDSIDNLQEKYSDNSPSFNYAYHHHLKKVIDSYAIFLQWETYPPYKTYEFLNDTTTRNKYLSKPFPDNKFSTMFSKTIQQTKKKEMINSAKQITTYVLKKMKGFKIDGWKVRTRIKK